MSPIVTWQITFLIIPPSLDYKTRSSIFWSSRQRAGACFVCILYKLTYFTTRKTIGKPAASYNQTRSHHKEQPRIKSFTTLSLQFKQLTKRHFILPPPQHRHALSKQAKTHHPPLPQQLALREKKTQNRHRRTHLQIKSPLYKHHWPLTVKKKTRSL